MRGSSDFACEVISRARRRGWMCIIARRRIGQKARALPGVGQTGSGSTLDQLATLIDWARLKAIYAAAKG